MTERHVQAQQRGLIGGISRALNRLGVGAVYTTEAVCNSVEVCYIGSDMGVTKFRSSHKINHYVTQANEREILLELNQAHPGLVPTNDIPGFIPEDSDE